VVEVLVRGKIPEEKDVEAQCSHCKSMLRFKASEGERSFHRNESYLSVKCPVCARVVCVESA
jgi:phage FluMu protein Com